MSWRRQLAEKGVGPEAPPSGAAGVARPRNYALAAFAAATDPWLRALQEVSDRLNADADVVAELDRVERPAAERRAQLDALLSAELPPGCRNLLLTMLERGDLHQLAAVVDYLAAMASGGPGARVALVTSALPMAAEQRRALTAKLRATQGDDLSVVFQTDPAIVGGLSVRLGDRVIDGSTATRMAAITESLLTPH